MDSYDVLIPLPILVHSMLRNHKEIQLSTEVRHTLHYRSLAVDNTVNHAIANPSLKTPTIATSIMAPPKVLSIEKTKSNPDRFKSLCDLSEFERLFETLFNFSSSLGA